MKIPSLLVDMSDASIFTGKTKRWAHGCQQNIRCEKVVGFIVTSVLQA